MNNYYKDIYGIWEVSTEGDGEGKSTFHLGTFIGFVDQIAFHLSDKTVYSLCFKKIKFIESYIPKSDTAIVQFDIDSETWGGLNNPKDKKTLHEISEAFLKRPVKVENYNYFGTFKLTKL